MGFYKTFDWNYPVLNQMNNFDQLKILLAGSALVATGLQFIWQVDSSTIFAVIVIWISFPIAFLTFLKRKNFYRTPLASLLMFGFWLTQLVLPLIATALEQKPISHNLEYATEVFLHTGICFIALAITYSFYIHTESVFKPIRVFAQRQFSRIGVFDKPDALHVFAIGGIGLLAMFYIYYFRPSAGIEGIRSSGGTIVKLVQASIFLAYVPFLIIFRKMYGDSRSIRPFVLPLVIYFLVLFVVALGRNSRAAFMVALLGMALCYFLGIMMGIYKVKLVSPTHLLVALGSAIFIFGPLSNVATAMQAVRNQRAETDRTDLMLQTIDLAFDQKALSAFRERREMTRRSTWDESYIDNPMLARFSNLKFASNTLDMYYQMNEEARANFQTFSIHRFWSIFPQPALSALRIRVNKAFVTSVSWGDYMHYLQTRNPYVLGGFRVTHFSGTGMAAFGWFYIPILCIGMWFAFFFFELFVVKTRDPSTGILRVRFSPLGLLDLAAIFMFLPLASVIMIFQFCIRAYWQIIFLYAGALFIAKRFLPRFEPKNAANRANPSRTATAADFSRQ